MGGQPAGHVRVSRGALTGLCGEYEAVLRAAWAPPAFHWAVRVPIRQDGGLRQPWASFPVTGRVRKMWGWKLGRP